MVMGSPLTGPAAPVVAATGGVIGTAGFVTNVTLDVMEGDVEGAATRVIIEVSSAGMGSMVTKAGGGKVAREMSDTVLSRTGEAVNTLIRKDEKEK